MPATRGTMQNAVPGCSRLPDSLRWTPENGQGEPSDAGMVDADANMGLAEARDACNRRQSLDS